MDCGVISNRFISPTSSTARKQSNICPLQSTNSKTINNNISKSNKSKASMPNEINSVSFSRRNVPSKYFSVSEISKVNTMSNFGGSDPQNSILNAAVKASRVTDSTVKPPTSHQNTNRQSSPICVPSSLFPQVNTVKMDSSITFNNNFLKSDDIHQTSNALAQLARLSSSFSLPENPKLSFTNLKSSTNLSDNRNQWIDTNNSNNSSHTQYDLQSLKRTKRRANSNSKYPSTPEESTSPNSAKRYMKDDGYPSFWNPVNSYPNNRDSDHLQSELENPLGISISPNMTTNVMNNPSQSANWANIFKYNEQLLAYKETSNIMHNKDTQEKFSYHLARSFLDFFYGKLANSMNSESNNFSTTKHNPLYKENDQKTTNHSFSENERRPMDWLANADLLNRQQTSIPVNPSVHHSSSASSNSFPCLLCGQAFHSNADLCAHVYTHLLTFHETKKSNNSEPVLKLLHSESTQLRNRQNGVFSEQRNSDVRTPFFLPPPPILPPPPLSVVTTSAPGIPSTCSMNYNVAQSFSTTDPSNHSSSPSDSMYLFQSYLSQWLAHFTNSSSNYQPNDTTNYNPMTNTSWTSDTVVTNKSSEYENWQGILTAYLHSLKESASFSTTSASEMQLPSTGATINTASPLTLPLPHSLHRTENPSYYDVLFGSKSYITPFPQS
uniref:C2H2-type domain-containing protein n=1 Tax=Trichobilharzia regenti TaxID=157069 RepID=A0AA85IR31_TRIRE|nr:unnamed protein product [Trichobilharzia regenti]